MLSVVKQAGFLFAGGVLCTVLAAAGLGMWEKSAYITEAVKKDKRTWVGYNLNNFMGLLLFSTFATLAVTLLYVSLQALVRHYTDAKEVMPIYIALVPYTLLAVLFFVIGMLGATTWGADPMKCGVLFCVGVDRYRESGPPRNTAGASINAGIGLMAFFSLCPLALVMLVRGYFYWRTAFRLAARSNQYVLDLDAAAEGTTRVQRQSMQLYKPRRWLPQLGIVLGIVLVLLFFAVISFYLPNDTRRFVASSIAAAAAKRSSRNVTGGVWTIPEVPGAFFITRSIVFSETFALKIFPGNAFFYGYLLLVIVMIWALRLTQGGRYWLKRRMPFYPTFSVGEGVFVVLTLLLSALFLLYWAHDHNYKGFWRPNKPVKGYMQTAELWGRAWGQLAVLFLSLLMFPISRHSVLNNLLGVSWESTMWVHRVLGYAMLLATVAHVVAWYVSYHQFGNLRETVVNIPTVVSSKRVRNDYSVLLASWATLLLFIAMGILALNKVRRRCFELFYYSHIVGSYVLLPVVLWHAAAGWQYMLPGLTLWLVDRLIRLFQSSARVTVRHARVIDEDLLEIAFVLNGRRRWHPGHYVFVNVPEISVLQWHPFTLSNPVVQRGETVFLLHIKSMGKGSWTHTLYRHIALGRPFSVGVEGPCGTPVDFTAYDQVYLVCGGIGVTPCASIYGSLLYAANAGLSSPRATMIWCTRSAALAGALTPYLGLPRSWMALVHTPSDAEHATSEAALPEVVEMWSDAGEGAEEVVQEADPERLATSTSESSREMTHQLQDGEVSSTQNQHHQEHHQRNASDELAGEETPALLPPAEESEVYAPAAGADEGVGDTKKMALPLQREGGGAPEAQFRCHLFLTRAADFQRVQRCPAAAPAQPPVDHHDSLEVSAEDVAELEDGVGAGAAVDMAAATAARSSWQVWPTRPNLRDEIRPDFSKVSCARVLIFVCGPGSLVREALRIGAALGVEVHQEEFLL